MTAITLNPTQPPHTNLLRAGMLLTVTGPTSPPTATTRLTMTRSGVTYLTNTFASGQGDAYGPFNIDLQYSVASSGIGSTVDQAESVHDGGGVALFNAVSAPWMP